MRYDRLLLPLTLPLAGAAAQQASAQAAAPAGRPNIILFMVDDMGWQDTSLPFWSERTFYNDRYETPNMERLARQGVMFTQAYACSLSSPTRCSLMTGSNAARHRVTNWTLRKGVTTDAADDCLAFPEWNCNGIAQSEGTDLTYVGTSFVDLLRAGGYHTIHCGKAHWGAIDTPGENPHHFGFEVNIAGHAAGGPATYLSERNYGYDADGRPQGLFAIPGLEKYWQSGTFLTEALTREAIAAMEKAVRYDRPFYLYMSHYAIHVPIDRDMRYYEKYLHKGLSAKEAAYASLIEGMDKSLGDIMDWLEQSGEADNTVIIFMSDNGGFCSSTGAAIYAELSPDLRQGLGLRGRHTRADDRIVAGSHGGGDALRQLCHDRGFLPDDTRDGGHRTLEGAADGRRRKFRAVADGSGRPLARTLPLLELPQQVGRRRRPGRGAYGNGALRQLEDDILLRGRP